MANLYWVTFRLEQNQARQRRYDALLENMRSITKGKWWTEPTSFLLFESDLKIDEVAVMVGDAIDPDCDMVLVGMPHFKAARVIGNVEDEDLLELLPFVKRV